MFTLWRNKTKSYKIKHAPKRIRWDPALSGVFVPQDLLIIRVLNMFHFNTADSEGWDV